MCLKQKSFEQMSLDKNSMHQGFEGMEEKWG